MPAVYEFFASAEHGSMTQEQVDAMPIYQASLRMGALSPDHTHLSMCAEDLSRYDMSKWKKRRKVTPQGI